MVSRPRQPIAAGEDLLCRFDAGVRPYWLRDWQSGFDGYTKVYEYQVDGATRRRFSMAHVVRPRTNSTNACLCFTLMSKLPEHKPWKRAAGGEDPSRGVILDLQEECDWKMPATVMLHTNEIALSLDDSTQVQCLPVYKSDRPKWTYRKVPKVTKFRNFERLPPWSRKPQGMTYQFCAENMTKTVIVQNLPDEERDDLLIRGILPQESPARDRHCIMCPVRRGSPKLLPCCLCYNWCQQQDQQQQQQLPPNLPREVDSRRKGHHRRPPPPNNNHHYNKHLQQPSSSSIKPRWTRGSPPRGQQRQLGNDVSFRIIQLRINTAGQRHQNQDQQDVQRSLGRPHRDATTTTSESGQCFPPATTRIRRMFDNKVRIKDMDNNGLNNKTKNQRNGFTSSRSSTTSS